MIDGKLTYLEVTDFGLKKSSKVRTIKRNKTSFIDSDSYKSRPEVTRNLLLTSCDEASQNDRIGIDVRSGIGIDVRSGIRIDVRSGIEVRSPPELNRTLQEKCEPTLDDEKI